MKSFVMELGSKITPSRQVFRDFTPSRLKIKLSRPNLDRKRFITVYIILLYQVVHWYMSLGTNATMEQSGLVSVVVGAGAAWFGLYTGSSKNNK